MNIPEQLVDAIFASQRPEPTERISFLLGSGFSRPDGMPLVSDINRQLSQLKESDFYLRQEMSAGFYTGDYRDPNAFSTLNDRRFASEFIAFYVETQLRGNHEAFNYEHFFDFFSEYLHERKHVAEVDKFCSVYNEKYTFKGQYDNGRNYLNKFLNIFNQLVASLLIRAKYYQDVSYTGGYAGYGTFCRLVTEVLKNYRVHVHSLNHDMLFDHMGSKVSGMFEHFTDGFSEAGSKYFGELDYRPRYIQEEFYKQYRVRLKHYDGDYRKRLSFFKLHGSVDYFPTYLRGNDKPVTIKRDYGVGEVLLERFDEPSQKFFYEDPFTNKYPAYLTGTTQKIKRYQDEFYYNLFQHFQDNLIHSKQLIVIGYGFQDAGINEYLEKHYLSQGRKILVVDIKMPQAQLIEKYKHHFIFSGGGVSDTPYTVYENFLRA
ncbi:hypothetical protein LT679_00350 [Mucilaginibacter roseus]|uniref:SIR2-like domain-containing protein n=1 Tax=Mucilaginibacter roseus TaxID=1528868 RepID=A0ABS8TYZ0_9SPHI|nr:hypothetical protein [Mucilaginibacter roseus]MCD8739035.1 hypothetical protein [Mucilaginibacter roseus]